MDSTVDQKNKFISYIPLSVDSFQDRIRNWSQDQAQSRELAICPSFSVRDRLICASSSMQSVAFLFHDTFDDNYI